MALDKDPNTRVLTSPTPQLPTAPPILLRDRTDMAIVLTWIIRLRWLAIAGQLSAVLISWQLLDVTLPLVTMFGIIALTVVSNLILSGLLRREAPLPEWLLPAVLGLDIALLTALLFFSGGPQNPFAVLYLTHVALAVVVLTPRWTWMVFAYTAAAYALLFWCHQPLIWHDDEPSWALPVGAWLALTLTAGLIVYFLGQLRKALRLREAQLTTMQSTLLQAEKLASLTTLAAGAAHELGTPLGTIAIVASELEREAKRMELSGRVLDDIQLVRSQVNRCRTIPDRMDVENMRDPDETPTTFSIREWLDDLREEVGERAYERIRTQIARNADPLTASRNTLTIAMQILVQNAIDASAADALVIVSIQREGDDAVIGVIDRGEGMTEAQLARAGEPFVTSKDPQKGMGLGLFLVRMMAETMHGTFTIRSTAGQGTTASLKFPAFAPAASGKNLEG